MVQAGVQPKILFIIDEKLSSEKTQLINRFVQHLRTLFSVTWISSGNQGDAKILRMATENAFSLVLAPSHRYWYLQKAYFESTQASLMPLQIGGYFTESLHWKNRFKSPFSKGTGLTHILVNLAKASPYENYLFIQALLYPKDPQRLFCDPSATHYWIPFSELTHLGQLIEFLDAPREMELPHWQEKRSYLTLLATQLWHMIHDQMLIRPSRRKDAILAFSLCYHSLCLRAEFNPGRYTTAIETFSQVWPNPTQTVLPSQILFRYSDFLKVHWKNSKSDYPVLDVTCGLFHNALVEKSDNGAQFFWFSSLEEDSSFWLPNLSILKETESLRPIQKTMQPSRAPEAVERLQRKALLAATQKIRSLRGTIEIKDRELLEVKRTLETQQQNEKTGSPPIIIENLASTLALWKQAQSDLKAQILVLRDAKPWSKTTEGLEEELKSHHQRFEQWIRTLKLLVKTHEGP